MTIHTLDDLFNTPINTSGEYSLKVYSSELPRGFSKFATVSSCFIVESPLSHVNGVCLSVSRVQTKVLRSKLRIPRPPPVRGPRRKKEIQDAVLYFTALVSLQ